MCNIITCSAHGCTATTTNPTRDGWSAAPAAERGGRLRYLCAYHSRNILGYTYENDTRRGVRETGFTNSTEFETNNPTTEFRSTLLHYGWVATSDCTVDVEFKSPIYEGLRWHKLLGTVERLISAGHADVGANCGTHHHVGHVEHIHPATIGWITEYYHPIYDGLSAHLAANPQKCQAVFGRMLGGWARDCRYEYADNHSNFINVEHAYTLEYRIPRFKSAAQYLHVMKWCQDATKAVINQFIMSFDTHGVCGAVARRHRDNRAAAVSKHLVKLFDRYYDTRPNQ